MSFENLEQLREALPAYAKDTKLNLGSVVGTLGQHLTEQQHWGTVLAVAAAVHSETTTPALAAEARQRLAPEAVDAALGAASVMAMNNIYYRAKHFLHGSYDDVRAGLRMQFIAAPGVAKADFELWCLAVSAITGCESCVASHEAVVREGGLSREAVNDALRIAAVVHAAAATLEAAELV
jgi:alkyl hydroperoxide reductase subunit D